MRFINTNSYNPRSYILSSQQKLKELRDCPDSPSRKAFLDVEDNRIWTILKSNFQRLSNNKCWFTEAYASLSDFQIEHFRPKKRVYLIRKKDDYPEKRTVYDNEGYWWLSYDIRNLKLVGAKPNQLKGNYFPLKGSSIIATPLNESWLKEECALLDPCVKDDVALLTYSGTIPIEYDPDPASWDHIRARISIKIFGLKHSKLKRSRAALFAHLRNYIDTGSRHWDYLQIHKAVKPAGYFDIRQIFIDVCHNITEMMNPRNEYTMMVFAHLNTTNLDWINNYVLNEAETRNYI